MEPVISILGSWAITQLATALWNSAGGQLQGRLQKTDLEKAIAQAKKAVADWEETVPHPERLFYSCKENIAHRYLNQAFTDSRVLEQLQRPLTADGTAPNVEVLVAVFAEVAIADEVKLNKPALKPWLQHFVDAYFERSSTYLNYQLTKTQYFKQLVNRCDDVKFVGIPVKGKEQEKSGRLVQIFVMPDVQEEAQQSVDYPLGALTEELSAGERQIYLLENQRSRSRLFASGKILPAQQLLTQAIAQKMVLLGAPGSGKTTLMRYFALQLAEQQPHILGLDPAVDWLPIVIPIRELPQQSDGNLLDFVCKSVQRMECKVPAGFFEYWLEDGRSLILLDGLDEVADEARRYDVVQRIEDFLQQYPHNRTIITSRPAGYNRGFFNTREFPHYELQPFDPPKIEQFIENWYRDRIADSQEANLWKNNLQKAIGGSDRLKLLAKNPLLLTIIALIHRYEAVLPKQRHELYDKAVDTLLVNWDQSKINWSDISENTGYLKKLQFLDESDLRRLMEQLATWIHSHPDGKTGDSEGGTWIDCGELLNFLTKTIQQLKQKERYQAKAEAERFLQLIQERTGLLNEQGQDCYAFVHKTFQEYLCACDIIYQADDEDDFEIVLNCIRNHLHDPHWREVLLLLIAQQKPKKALRALQTILEANSPYEAWLHRDLLFAGTCLAEDPKNLKAEDKNGLTETILNRLVELEVSASNRIGEIVKNLVFKILCSFGETAFQSQVLQLLKAHAATIDQVRFARYQAALGEEQEAIATLLTLLKDSNSGVRSSAIRVLGELGNGSEAVVSALLALLEDSDFSVRFNASRILGKLGNGSEAAVSALLALLKDSDPVVRSSATWGLSELRKKSDVAVNALLALLQDSKLDVRSSTVWALGRLGKKSDVVVNALLALLQDSKPRVRSSAAQALGNVGKGSEAVLSGLLALLQDSELAVRLSAAQALGEVGKGSDAVVSCLLALLQDSNSEVRLSTARALVYVGNGSEVVVSYLLALLQDSDSEVRSSAAQVLSNVVNGSEVVVSCLLALLQDSDSEVRFNAARALGNVGKESEAVMNGLLALLQDAEWSVRSSVARALGEVGKGLEVVVSGLVTLLQDSDSLVRFDASQALGKLGKVKSQRELVESTLEQWIAVNQNSEFVGEGIDALRLILEGDG